MVGLRRESPYIIGFRRESPCIVSHIGSLLHLLSACITAAGSYACEAGPFRSFGSFLLVKASALRDAYLSMLRHIMGARLTVHTRGTRVPLFKEVKLVQYLNIHYIQGLCCMLFTEFLIELWILVHRDIVEYIIMMIEVIVL